MEWFTRTYRVPFHTSICVPIGEKTPPAYFAFMYTGIYSKGPPRRRPEEGVIPIQGGPNRLALLGNCTHNLERIRWVPPMRRSYCNATSPPHTASLGALALLGYVYPIRRTKE